MNSNRLWICLMVNENQASCYQNHSWPPFVYQINQSYYDFFLGKVRIMGDCLRSKIKSMFIFIPTTPSTQPNLTKSEVWFLKMTLQHHHKPPSHNKTNFVIVVSSSFLGLTKIMVKKTFLVNQSTMKLILLLLFLHLFSD